MKKETGKPKHDSLDELLISAKSRLQHYTESFGKKFNTLSPSTKRVSLIACGISMACVCVFIVLQALYGHSTARLSTDQITLPNDMYMNEQNEEKLTPIGKMKGELDGEFEAFYVAVDYTGQLFINHNPEFSKDSLLQSKGWEPITRQQLEVYEKHLHFIPQRKNGLKH
jgi:hypothetical protein